ncbi:MAG: uroporphyrinogen-III synthase [Acidobacteria bacterium]|nr:uroporphyrinogen-III synthase [Acidobacteriota bacterium]
MPSTRAAERHAWRVAVTRQEAADGPLSEALRRHGLVPVPCPVMLEVPPSDPGPISRAATHLDAFDWVICASARAVRALELARSRPWPAGVRTAAVGEATARALEALGVIPPPVVGPDAGADALWSTLADLDTWPGRRVLVLSTPGGRTTLVDGLRGAGAAVEVVDAYAMAARDAADIRDDWARARADAAVLASPRAAATLVAAVGREALAALRAVVAIGPTTARELAAMGIACVVPERAAFDAAAATLASLQTAEVAP